MLVPLMRLLALTLLLVACGRTELLPGAPEADAAQGTGGAPPASGGSPGAGGGAVATGGAGGATTPVIVEFPLPTEGADPRRITTGPDGNLWLTECRPNQIAQVTLAGAITEMTLPSVGDGPHCPQGITASR